jgi:FlaA1/EpsC-like NDP-sugar epimerase
LDLIIRLELPLAWENDHRWDELLPPRESIDDSMASEYVAGKTVLVTGAGGSIGSALARKILGAQPRELLLLDHAENALYQVGRSLSENEGTAALSLIIGDAADSSLITALLEEHQPDLILHAAAYKHVPLMEANPFAAVANNTVLTWQLAKLAAESGVPQLLLISTDKAANPRSILGASKRAAELATLRWSDAAKRYSAMRLVNVLGSTGSVVPLFLEQIARGGPLTVTHPDATRHFMTMEDTVRLILVAAGLGGGESVYVPKLSEPVRILELAQRLLRVKNVEGQPIEIEFTGLRLGEKLVEDILGSSESASPSMHPAIQRATARKLPAEELDRAIAALKESVERRDLTALLAAMCELVPEYEPSGALSAPEQITQARASHP